nr:50S ribosomal protein L22P [uncultured archaeon]
MIMNEPQQLTATATGRSLEMSYKVGAMLCRFLRGKKLVRAKRDLEAVVSLKLAVPFPRFNSSIGHTPTTAGPGKYPIKAATQILMLLKSAEANATNKGMTGDLMVSAISANKAGSFTRPGRQSRRKAKRAHVWVTLTEIAGTRKERKEKKTKQPEAAVETAPAENVPVVEKAAPKPMPKAAKPKAPAKKSQSQGA